MYLLSFCERRDFILSNDRRLKLTLELLRYLSPEIVPTGQSAPQCIDTSTGYKHEGGGTGLSIGLGAGLKRVLHQSSTEGDNRDEEVKRKEGPPAAVVVAAAAAAAAAVNCNNATSGSSASTPRHSADDPCRQFAGPRSSEGSGVVSAAANDSSLREDLRNSVPEWYKRGCGMGNLLEQAESLDWQVLAPGRGCCLVQLFIIRVVFQYFTMPFHSVVFFVFCDCQMLPATRMRWYDLT